MSGTVDRFIPAPDAGGSHQIVIRAPAELVFDVAEHFELQSIPLVRAIFRLRCRLLGVRYEPLRKGLVEETMGLGWGKLVYTPGCELVMGSVTQPWEGDVKFRSVAPADFAGFREPGLVKIAWTLEAEPLGRALTRFRTQTMVSATDEAARKRFRKYWRTFGVGILMIRLLALPAMKRKAEKLYASRATA